MFNRLLELANLRKMQSQDIPASCKMRGVPCLQQYQGMSVRLILHSGRSVREPVHLHIRRPHCAFVTSKSLQTCMLVTNIQALHSDTNGEEGGGGAGGHSHPPQENTAQSRTTDRARYEGGKSSREGGPQETITWALEARVSKTRSRQL